MTTFSPDQPAPLTGMLLRELNHRINNQFASAINLISVAAVRAEGTEAKLALSNAAELLHAYAGVHRALIMPECETLIDAVKYLGKLCGALRAALLDRLHIKLTLQGDALPLQPERCWRLGLIIHELVMNSAKHAWFDGRPGEIKIKLARTDWLVNCVASDNGSAASCGGHGQGLRIVGDLAKSLGGRVEHGVGADFRSVVISFRMSERERQANSTIDSRAARPVSRALARCGTNPLEQGGRALAAATLHEADLPCTGAREPASPRSADLLRGLLSPSNPMDVL